MPTSWGQFGLLVILSVFAFIASLPTSSAAGLDWQPGIGVQWRNAWAEVDLDSDGNRLDLRLQFPNGGSPVRFGRPKWVKASSNQLVLQYQVALPSGTELGVIRTLQIAKAGAQAAVVESFELRPTAPISEEVEIVRPFSIWPAASAAGLPDAGHGVLPLKNGWAKTVPLSAEPVTAEYRLGHWLGGTNTMELALPVVHLDVGPECAAALFADPRFSAQFTLAHEPGRFGGEVRYRYAGSQVPLTGPEVRRFGFSIGKASPNYGSFERSIDAFFRWMLPEVQPGPSWLQSIYMIDYDFLSDSGRGWEQDIDCLTTWLKPAERRHVALCLHGWYDALGAYAFDETTGRLRDHWVAMERTRHVEFTPGELRRRLRFARERGYRTLLYFGDGLAADSGVAGYHDAWAYRDQKGNPITGWQGPDTFGKTYLMNAAHPDVRRRFLNYLDALLHAVGRDVDGFVWDETFHAPAGQITREPTPAYCDRAMLDLVRDLTARVKRFDREKVFLASDCVGITPGIPGYAMVADGLYQDTHCQPERWPDALFPNWRNTYWSCNWGATTHFEWTRFGVTEFGAPVAISNGWEEDRGPHEWTLAEREQFLKLFRQRLARGPSHVRYLTTDPAQFIATRKPAKPGSP